MKTFCGRLIYLALVTALCFCGCASTNSAQLPSYDYEEPLSSSCDYILSSGIDVDGNSYELVANQTESALGYEISVGIIKNNEWLYPMSKDFPFLSEDGLFHRPRTVPGDTVINLSYPTGPLIHFIDTGAFLMEGSCESSHWSRSADDIYVVFSCDTLESYTINCEESTLLYEFEDYRTEFDGYRSNLDNYRPELYDHRFFYQDRIFTDNGKLILFTETSGTISGWTEDQVFDWCVLDVQTLSLDTIASGVEGIYPESVLSEGLVFASDQCFYDTNAQKIIDLSTYNIDMFYDSDIYFEKGQCTFKARNDLGTEFLITIDSSGTVLNEIKQ